MKARMPIRPMSSAERQAVKAEIKRQLAEYDTKHATEIDAMVLWILHDKFGFGAKRLRQFHDCFFTAMDELKERYEMENEEIWLCTHKLKALGIDVDTWAKEST